VDQDHLILLQQQQQQELQIQEAVVELELIFLLQEVVLVQLAVQESLL
jgi:hypothetical protein